MVFVKSILAGMCIGLGGTAYLVVGGIAGAFLFSIALFTICERDYYLYTGKVCYPSWLLKVFWIWLGNLFGCLFISVPFKICNISVREKAMDIVTVKLNRAFPEMVMLGILCGICVYIAVDGFKNNPHELGKYLSLFFGVMIFIICGFEHVVANMFYFSVANMWSLLSFGYLAIMILGNSVGGVLFPLCDNFLFSYTFLIFEIVYIQNQKIFHYKK